MTHVEELKSFDDALSHPEWFDAMKTEIDSLRDHDVWELVELPKDRKLVGSKWVFKVKRNADGSLERCKARLVAQGWRDSTMMKLSVQLYDQSRSAQ